MFSMFSKEGHEPQTNKLFTNNCDEDRMFINANNTNMSHFSLELSFYLTEDQQISKV